MFIQVWKIPKKFRMNSNEDGKAVRTKMVSSSANNGLISSVGYGDIP